MSAISYRFLGRAFCGGGLFALAVVLAAAAPAAAQSGGATTAPAESTAAIHINLDVNNTTVINTKLPLRRVSVGKSEIAEVNLLGAGNILVTGKAPGTTQVIVWDESDHAQVYDVQVQTDVTGLADQIRSLFPSLHIEVRAINGAVAVRGHVPSLTVADQVMQVAKPYSKDVLDLLEISGGQQVMVQVRFAEVSRTATEALGVNMAMVAKSFSAGSNIGGVNATSLIPTQSTVGNSPVDGLPLTAANAVAPVVTLYGAGEVGSYFLEYFINSLRENNLMRILAEPNVMAVSGQEASFLAGGEYPIPVTQSSGSGSSAAISIEYKDYGIKLKFLPVVMGDGRIRMKVSPEVSELDYANGVTLNGYVVPALTQRSVSTTVELSDGQSFAVAGLLDNEVTATKSVTPLLGDIPILGALFRSVSYQRGETELVVLVTPRLVEPLNPGQVPPLPGDQWRHPTENELFYMQDLGGPPTAAAAGAAGQAIAAAPRFHGVYGFVPAAAPAAAPVASSN